jgi:hypothetical protein
MLAGASVLPFAVVATLVVVAIGFVTIPRLLRAVGASTIISDTPEPGSDVVKCGFSLLEPGRLTSSLGTCTLRVSDSELAVRTPLGDYKWERGVATVSPVRTTSIAFALRLSDGNTVADVLVRDAAPVTAALRRHNWLEPA